MLQSLFYRGNIILNLKSDRNNITIKGNYRPFLMIDMDTKILNRIVANQIQQYIKRIIYCDQLKFILGMQGWFNICKSIHTDKLKTKTHNFLKRCRKTFNKIQEPFMINTLNKVIIEGVYLKIIKSVHDKP